MNCNHEDKIDRLIEDVQEIRHDQKELIKTVLPTLAALNVKSGFWGMLGGMLPLIAGILVYLVNK